MTDGEASAGITSVNQLSKLVDEQFYNTFVGFGLQHNAALFNKFNEKKNTEYQFIDTMENTSLIYGETIHKFIYPAIKNAEFRVIGGKIYDYSTNEWTDCLTESIITSDVEKIYHLRTDDPHNIIVTISGEQCSSVDSHDFNKEHRILDDVYPIPDLIDSNTDLPQLNEDLTKYAFRQKVQELMYQTKCGIDRSDRAEFKKKLKIAFKTIKKYMRINDLKDDGLLKMLCDDISVIYRTFDSSHSIMYASARCNSQGRQRTYNTNDTVNFNEEIRRGAYLATPRLKRTKTNSFQDIQEFLRVNNFPDEISSIGSRSPSPIPTPDSSIEFEDDDFNNTTFNTYRESGFVSDDSSNGETVFRNLFGDDIDFLDEDEIETYVPENINTTFFATPGVLETMRNINNV